MFLKFSDAWGFGSLKMSTEVGVASLPEWMSAAWSAVDGYFDESYSLAGVGNTKTQFDFQC